MKVRRKMKTNRNSYSRVWVRLIGPGLIIAVLLAACAPAAAPAPTNSITGIVWQWISVTNQTTKETQTVPVPQNYTITFNTDGTLTGKADCNNFTGTYSQQNGFSIKLGASTMAYCGEASLDQQYLQLLGSVAGGGPDGAGGLVLETAGGEQRMVFKNGGAAPK
jgi:heat shock protein HslJ